MWKVSDKTCYGIWNFSICHQYCSLAQEKNPSFWRANNRILIVKSSLSTIEHIPNHVWGLDISNNPKLFPKESFSPPRCVCVKFSGESIGLFPIWKLFILCVCMKEKAAYTIQGRLKITHLFFPYVSETAFKNVGENLTPIIFHQCCWGKDSFLSPSPLIFSSLVLPHTVCIFILASKAKGLEWGVFRGHQCGEKVSLHVAGEHSRCCSCSEMQEDFPLCLATFLLWKLHGLTSLLPLEMEMDVSNGCSRNI